MAGPGLGYEILGAVKVKDGLFIGDELAAQDLEFVVSNKVTRVINCCGRQVPNHWESIGVVYLTYYWVDADSQIILDQRDVVANEIFRFVEEALAGAESVLIHSVRGQSRSCCVLSAYMMKKYSWGLRKTMEFLSFRRPDMNLKPAFLQQLSGYERRLMAQSKFPFSLDWNDADFSRLECEDLLLRNTYINSQMGPLAEFHSDANGLSARPRKLVWLDNDSGDKLRLEKPAGADRHNPAGCDPSQQRSVMKCVLKKARSQASPCAPVAERMDPVNWPTAGGENPEVHHPPPVNVGGVAAPGPRGPPEVVPTAWAADGEPPSAPTDGYPPRPRAGGGAAAKPPAAAAHEPVLHQGGGGKVPGLSNPQLMQRGPATNIRDSLSVSSSRRGDSQEPNLSRPRSRDPSPKTGQGRQPSPGSYRGESPLRYPSRGSRSGAGPTTAGRGPASASPAPGSGSMGGVLNSVRGTSAPAGPALSGSQVPGGGASRGGSGMGAFRGGPVRAKAEILGDGSQSLRRNRPATAPTGGTRSGSRPASPLGSTQRSGSNSRPASPQNQRAPASRPPMPSMGGYPPARHSLSSHMRRAPSPTPAFNRNPSPSKPRWRT